MIEKKEWKRFAKMLIILAGIFILNFLDNLTSLVVVVAIGTIFFIVHINNKIRLISYFNNKSSELNGSINEIQLKMREREVAHDDSDPDGYVSDKKKKEMERIGSENIRSFAKIKEISGRAERCGHRKEFLVHLNEKKWDLWFSILLCLAFFRMLDTFNMLLFSSSIATIVSTVSCLYIFYPKLEDSIVSATEECDISYTLYKTKLIFGEILLVLFFSGIATHQNFPILITLFAYVAIFTSIVMVVQGPLSGNMKSPKQCTTEYLRAYKSGITWKENFINTTIEYYQYAIGIFVNNSSFSYKSI